jgi:hypothetical protein
VVPEDEVLDQRERERERERERGMNGRMRNIA